MKNENKVKTEKPRTFQGIQFWDGTWEWADYGDQLDDPTSLENSDETRRESASLD